MEDCQEIYCLPFLQITFTPFSSTFYLYEASLCVVWCVILALGLKCKILTHTSCLQFLRLLPIPFLVCCKSKNLLSYPQVSKWVYVGDEIRNDRYTSQIIDINESRLHFLRSTFFPTLPPLPVNCEWLTPRERGSSPSSSSSSGSIENPLYLEDCVIPSNSNQQPVPYKRKATDGG